MRKTDQLKKKKNNDLYIEKFVPQKKIDLADFRKKPIKNQNNKIVKMKSNYNFLIKNIIIIILTSFSIFFLLNPENRFKKIVSKFILLSYKNNDSKQYGKGLYDFCFVLFYSLVFILIREFFMSLVLELIVKKINFKKKNKNKRFKEQLYQLIYYCISGSFGLMIMYNLPLWYFNTKHFYLEYPHKTHNFYFKLYYLGQISFWVHQFIILVFGLEKPRKDFNELVVHHIITLILVFCSYKFHFTWIGLPVYITMDISDFFLSLSKLLNYLNSKYTDFFFAIFILSWIYLRHYLNLKILWSVLTEFKTIGKWGFNLEKSEFKCSISQILIFFLLGILQILNIYWFYLILGILKKYLSGNAPHDDRSDDEN